MERLGGRVEGRGIRIPFSIESNEVDSCITPSALDALNAKVGRTIRNTLAAQFAALGLDNSSINVALYTSQSPSMEINTIGAFISHQLKIIQLSPKDLAKRANITMLSLDRYMADRITPTPSVMDRIKRELDLDEEGLKVLSALQNRQQENLQRYRQSRLSI